MDHLPAPSVRGRPSRNISFFGDFDVPFLGRTPEAGIDFEAYAIQQGIVERGSTAKPLVRGLNEAEDADLYYAKVQAWLFFGLIAEVFGSKTRFEDFIVIDASSQQQSINTIRLKQYISQWHKETPALSKHTCDERNERLRQSTMTAWRFCDRIDHIGLALSTEHMLVLFSIRILITSIWGMLSVSGDSPPDLKLNTDLIKWPRFPPSYRPLVALMDEHWWCSHEVLRVLGTYTVASVWTIVCIQGPASLDHHRCEAAAKCVARDVDPFNHQAVHLTSGCSCDAVGPNIEEVKDLIRNDRIPLIRCQVTEGSKISFKVIPVKRARTHYAISHIWADGIVIPTQNKVYRCQFLKLVSYLSKAQAEVQADSLPIVPHKIFRAAKHYDIWFDIFCIPTARDAASKALRKQAIGRIAPVFAGAKAVLIVDKALTQVNMSNAAITEVMARIACSGWMTRCWTFSEASLALKSVMLFCMGDRVVRYDDLNLPSDSLPAFKSLDVVSKSFFKDVHSSTFVQFNVAWYASQPVVTDYVAFCFIWNSLVARSTSHPGDTWGIMATLLGYNGKEIMDLEEHDRLPALMRRLPRVPASFVFRDLVRSPLGHPALRWMPIRVQGTIRDADGTFDLTDEGIRFDNSVRMKFVLTTVETLPPQFSFELDPKIFRPSDGGAPINFQITIHDHTALQLMTGAAEICIILQSNVHGPGATSNSDSSGLEGTGCCLHVHNARPNSEIEAEFLSSLSFKSDLQPLPCHLQARPVGSTVILTSNRQEWYRPKISRRKHSLPPWVTSNLFLFGIPGSACIIWLLVMVPLWIWYAKTDQSQRTLDILVYLSAGLGLLVAATILVVVFHEGFLFQNWVDSFMVQDKPQRWWEKIMPFY